MSEIIDLRVVGFTSDGIFHFICLETDIAVSAETLYDAKAKMQDALLSYFTSFSAEQIRAHAFQRSAPLRYSFLWYTLNVVGFVKRFFFSSKGAYDPQSRELRFA